jgi:acetyl esterase/lipase
MPIDLEALANLIEVAPSKDEKSKGEKPSPPPQPPAPTGQEVRARWFRTAPRPLPPEVLKRAGAIPEVHGLQGCWNIVGNRLSSGELAALLAALGEGGA